MKRLLLLLFVLPLFNAVIACSCSNINSFCVSHQSYNFSASVVITNSFPHGVSLKVLHVIHGTETRDTITVWDNGGPYNTCNDSLEVRASNYGNIGDTIILAINNVSSTPNGAWQIPGDYVTEPMSTCNESLIPVKKQYYHGNSLWLLLSRYAT